MNNRGQTTVLFSLIISVLLLFTLTALEVGRVYMSHVKVASVIQSTKLSIMADYNRELFERYHLLFADYTYGTGSEAVLEEKIEDYIVCSLKEEKGNIYTFNVEDIQLIDEENVLDKNMKRLKEQIESYEKTAGVLHRAKDVANQVNQKTVDIDAATKETETNAVELPTSTKEKEDDQEKGDEKIEKKKKPDDPRETIKESLKFGILSFLKPNSMEVSTTSFDFSSAPSAQYKEMDEDIKDSNFEDISILKQFLKKQPKEKSNTTILERAAFLDYVDYHFSNAVNQKQDSVLKCEVEYILKGKKNDYDNLQAVVNDIVWMRMPVNYAYLLTDEQKKTEALTVAAAICTATGTEALIEVVKYLLLGCWAYGESLCDTKQLLEGKAIPYAKTKVTWQTDLSNPTVASKENLTDQGMKYEDYLILLLAKKNKKALDTCYARMLDAIELNMQQDDEKFYFKNYVYQVTVQGKIRLNPLFVTGKDASIYEYYFEEKIQY
ncbi:MAG: DUF5702 domain-containing protein [Eubacteriales bacterium]|nr:DUF5702 domain-containing protein [Eubacteriales bacterium]